MFFVNGICRLIILWCPIAYIQISHFNYLADFASYQELCTQLFAYAAVMMIFMDTLNPKTEIEIRQTLFAGRTGLFVATVLPLLALYGQSFAYADLTKSRIIFLNYHAIILLTNGLAYYLAFFHWAASPRPAQKFLWVEALEAKIKKSGFIRGTWEGFGIFCKWTGMAAVGVFVIFLVLYPIMEYKTPSERVYSEHQSKAYDQAKIKAEIQKAEYVAKNCKEMPDDEFYKLRNEIEETEFATIRKAYEEQEK